MKVAVVGSRSFNDYEMLNNYLKNYDIECIISGGAIGADTLAYKYAFENNIKTLIFKPKWKLYGKAAGMIRNKEIVKEADLVIAFWNNYSKGTKNSIELAKKMNKDVIVIVFS